MNSLEVIGYSKLEVFPDPIEPVTRTFWYKPFKGIDIVLLFELVPISRISSLFELILLEFFFVILKLIDEKIILKKELHEFKIIKKEMGQVTRYVIFIMFQIFGIFSKKLILVNPRE